MISKSGVTLRRKLELSTQLPQYQPEFLWQYEKPTPKNRTTCNIFARDFLDSKLTPEMTGKWAESIGSLISYYNYDLTAINPGKTIRTIILDTTIQQAYENVIRNITGNTLILLTMEQAQQYANGGMVIHVISAMYNHEAIVCPTGADYDNDLGCLLGQCGRFCGILYFGDKRTFGVYGDAQDVSKDCIFVRYPML